MPNQQYALFSVSEKWREGVCDTDGGPDDPCRPDLVYPREAAGGRPRLGGSDRFILHKKSLQWLW